MFGCGVLSSMLAVKTPSVRKELEANGTSLFNGLARSHPQLDLTDIYAFESDLPGKTCFVLICQPQIPGRRSWQFFFGRHLQISPWCRQG